jgi:trehalose 6-phosphate synthase/phosphatase
MTKLVLAELLEKYRNSNNRLVLLDYDGTLVEFTSLPKPNKLPSHISDILTKLVKSPKTEVIIITGRCSQDIDIISDNLKVKIIAEHGAMIKERGIWKNLINKTALWKEIIIPILNRITQVCPGSLVEEKHFTLAWHYRNTDSQTGFRQSRELISILTKIIHSYNLKILNGNKVVEIMAEEIGKGNSIKKLVENFQYDFILSIGDDTTDEDIFKYLMNNENAYTIKVGNGDTFARYKLVSTSDVITLLKHLSE